MTNNHNINVKALFRKYFWVIIFIIILLLQDFFLKPFVKNLYLSDDIKNFKEFSWKYTVSAIIILAGIIIFISKKNVKPSSIPLILLALIVFGSGFYFAFHSLVDNSLLLINSETKKTEIIKVYEVVYHKGKKVFWLNNENSIHDKEDLQKINHYKVSKGLKSIFDLQNNDTVEVTFNKGWFDIDYLEK
ncbi:hypothetical protein QX233_09975 [Chryseobacterium gambrini]|uniref:Uncharacterized protein n=1 Tax=Chryseobacterium gambrini TaxID=373672 RepID=A0AAJ1R5Q7_9FLAO|nr:MULTISPECIES: hypothetical protein [Chryseobacterium]MDN4012789.1 hypothetical protein [Chryseobacterium gambrini]MDN4030327.1 hypothetical protein [Chryseobacterium gambrini]QWA39388.1 hypothetical protein KKI44_04025 [Chryseobacterium sp. ZHDP1]